MNFESEPLTKEGASAIRQDSACQERVIKSYRMMLRFYGFRLADEATGRVERDPSGSQRLEDHLNSSPHNWLRISRIITSLGELGFPRYKRPLFDALKAEVESGALINAARSMNDFWRPLVEDEDKDHYARKTLEAPEDRVDGCLFSPGGRLGPSTG